MTNFSADYEGLLSPEYRARKIIQAIAECDRYIAKEEPRAADLRPAKVQQHLDYCKAHRVKLSGMLEELGA